MFLAADAMKTMKDQALHMRSTKKAHVAIFSASLDQAVLQCRQAGVECCVYLR